MYSNQKKAVAYILLGFSPLISLIYVIRNLNNKTKLLFFTLFGAIYGLTINYLEGHDAWTHVQSLKKYYSLDLDEFIYRLWKIISFNPPPSSPDDLYIHFLFGIAGSIFQSPVVLFGMVGAVYGYFYGSALIKVIKFSKNQKITILLLIFITLFVVLRSFENMQTIRSWTGLWVLFNGVVGYYQTKKRKFILLILFSPFFHFMYIIIALPALIQIYFKVLQGKLLIGLYLISFAMSVNTLLVIDYASDYEFTENKLHSYYRISDKGEEMDPIAERKKEDTSSWYTYYGKQISIIYGTNYFIIFLILAGYYKKEIMTYVEYSVFSTGVLMAALANFLNFSSSLYGRTMANASIYVFAVMVLLLLRGCFKMKGEPIWKNIAIWLGVLIFIPKIFHFASDFMYRTSMLIIGLPFLNFLGDDYNFSIRDFINQFF